MIIPIASNNKISILYILHRYHSIIQFSNLLCYLTSLVIRYFNSFIYTSNCKQLCIKYHYN